MQEENNQPGQVITPSDSSAPATDKVIATPELNPEIKVSFHQPAEQPIVTTTQQLVANPTNTQTAIPDTFPANADNHSSFIQSDQPTVRQPDVQTPVRLPDTFEPFRPKDRVNNNQFAEQADQFSGIHQQPATALNTPGELSWTASEYIAKAKSSSWYAVFSAGGVLVAGGVYFITKDILSTVIVAAVALVLIVFAGRKPQTRNYAVNTSGVTIGQKLLPYDSFKSFSILTEDNANYISLMPTKRFLPPMAIYYEPEKEDKILEILGDYLPVEERDHDLVERITQRVRF